MLNPDGVAAGLTPRVRTDGKPPPLNARQWQQGGKPEGLPLFFAFP